MKTFEEWTRELIETKSQEDEDIYVECHSCGDEIDVTDLVGEYCEGTEYYCNKDQRCVP